MTWCSHSTDPESESGMRSDFGFQHLQQQPLKGDTALAVQLQEVSYSMLSSLSQQGEGHKQAASSLVLPAG